MQVQGNNKVYTGVWQGLKHMMATEGVRGMMKGNLANCIRIVPNSAMKFLTYEQLSRRVQLKYAAQLGHSSASVLSAYTWLPLHPLPVARYNISSGLKRMAFSTVYDWILSITSTDGCSQVCIKTCEL